MLSIIYGFDNASLTSLVHYLDFLLLKHTFGMAYHSFQIWTHVFICILQIDSRSRYSLLILKNRKWYNIRLIDCRRQCCILSPLFLRHFLHSWETTDLGAVQSSLSHGERCSINHFKFFSRISVPFASFFCNEINMLTNIFVYRQLSVRNMVVILLSLHTTDLAKELSESPEWEQLSRETIRRVMRSL